MPTKTSAEPFHYRFTRAYDTIKGRYPDTIVLLRGGDYYEALDDDARTLAKTAVLTIGKSRSGRPQCGVPYHAIDRTVETLVAAGHRVAVCEFTDPS